MISTRRITAAIGLAVAVTGLATSLAQAAEADVPGAGRLSPGTLFDSLAARDVPAEHQGDVVRVYQHWPR
ncbi:hypothetical protein [Streptomyces sp. NPDC050287]|uniref:hypothetical protein n=1 Tax=Streptomyces sp. NPDC050287 TaxID=3365608 RepID=UPI00379FB2FA